MEASKYCLYAASAGILSHLLYFIHGEHHVETPTLLALSILLPTLHFTFTKQYTDTGVIQSALNTSAITASYLSGLWASMIIYRIFFHRLRKFPGPFMFKVSKLLHASKLIPHLDNYLCLDALHKKYGDFVRTGPGEISIFHPDAVPILLGPGSKCSKAPWYDNSLPSTSMHTLRNRADHDRRRRLWDRGLSSKALRTYEDRIAKYTRDLITQISSSSGKAMNVTKWFHLYSVDVMGDFAFGKDYGMIKSGKAQETLNVLHDGMKPFGVLTPIPWVFLLLSRIPGLSQGYKGFVSWCDQQVDERMKMKMEVPDVMSHLVDAFKDAQDPVAARLELSGDSRLIIIAGSDTTSATLTYIFYHLAADPSHVTKLREELNNLTTSQSQLSSRDIQYAEHLNGVINEALRLHPPVPSGLQRLTPPEGITVAETFIPGNTTVIAPFYTIARLESCFVNPDDFIPERWYSKPEMVKNKAAFAPFSIGPYSCVGKQIALMEVRSVVAEVISKFDIHFAEGEDGTTLFKTQEDLFTVAPGELNLNFIPIKVEV